MKNLNIELRKETRFALVLYGGISLAIYIYGVANEFFNAVRGRRVYKLLKILLDTDIVIDVISGTSAGGINGIFLSSAIANDKEFSSAANLWRKKGGLSDLMRGVDDEISTYKSLLNSEHYYFPELYEAFKKMTSDENSISRIDELKSLTENIDLFITGTNLEGNFYYKLDDSQNKIEYKDHRSVFILKYRNRKDYTVNQFEGKDETFLKAISKLAQLTSCFPFAFSPVNVNDTDEDKLLKYWGNLEGENYFVDGGVLDNKPFSYTIKAIFTKKADRLVDRHLVFVEPDPKKEEKSVKFAEPNLLKVLKLSLLTIPQYESISDDLNLIINRNLKISQINEFTQNLNRYSLSENCCKDGKDQIYIRARLNFDVNQAVELVLQNTLNINVNDAINKFEKAKKLKKFLSDKIEESIDLYLAEGNNSPSINIDEIFNKLDVYFRLRRIYGVIYKLYNMIESYSETKDKELYDYLIKVWKNLNIISSLYEIIKSNLEKALSKIEIQNDSEEQIWIKILNTSKNVLDIKYYSEIVLDDILFEKRLDYFDFLSNKLGKLNLSLKNNSKLFAEQNVNQNFNSILDYCEKIEIMGIDDLPFLNPHELTDFYYKFINYDCKVFPLEIMADIYEKDIIKFHRFSPFDCQSGFSKKDAYSKITGNELYHFGAFLKRSWRSNDILWGRIDTAGGIINLLFSNDNFLNVLQNNSSRLRIASVLFDSQDNFNPDWKMDAVFPEANKFTHSEIERLFKKLILQYSDYGIEKSSKPENEKFKEIKSDIEDLKSLLIETEQLEIFKEEYKNVIEDAVEEQFEWNTEQKEATSGNKENKTAKDSTTVQKPWIFKSLQQSYDNFIRERFSKEHADEFVSAQSLNDERKLPKNTKLGNYLLNVYDIGKEKIKTDIPYVVFLHLIAKALMVVKNIVLNLIESCKVKVPRKMMLIFTLCFAFPLRTFYGLTSIMRRNFGFGMGLFIGLNFVSLILLTLHFIFVNDYDHESFYKIVFIIIPIIITSSSIFILYFNSRKLLFLNIFMVLVIIIEYLVFYFFNIESTVFHRYVHCFVLTPISIMVLSAISLYFQRRIRKVNK